MMKNTIEKSLLIASTLTLGVASIPAYADSNDYFEPPMVNIPAGDFLMGSDRGDDDEKPVHKVSVPAFQMGKYEVTYAEFEKFIAATDYPMSDDCYQYVLGGGTEMGRWNDNVYKYGDFYPVVCLRKQAAVDYAAWLSKETGKHYRLPTEAEWEYTVRGGTNTRHFFGEDHQTARSCEYANISEWYAFTKSSEQFENAYVRDVEQCSDNEATLSIVGLYKPNPFGVYDLVGNVMEYLADCYVDSYEGAPTDGSARITEDCEQFVVRGGSWHWYPWRSSKRGPHSNDFLGALEGFRLVLDTDGKVLPTEKGSKDFVAKLDKAREKQKAKHRKNLAFPRAPQGVAVHLTANNKVAVNWHPNSEKFVTGYNVYRQDPMTNTTKLVGKNVRKTQFVDHKPLGHNARYHVVALNKQQESIPSTVVDSAQGTVHQLPAKIEGEAHIYGPGSEVRYSRIEPNHDKIINSLEDNAVSYQVKVEQDGAFTFKARVYHRPEQKQFELWVGDKMLLAPALEGEGGWVTVENLNIALPAGVHTLTVKGGGAMFAINWFELQRG